MQEHSRTSEEQSQEVKNLKKVIEQLQKENKDLVETNVHLEKQVRDLKNQSSAMQVKFKKFITQNKSQVISLKEQMKELQTLCKDYAYRYYILYHIILRLLKFYHQRRLPKKSRS